MADNTALLNQLQAQLTTVNAQVATTPASSLSSALLSSQQTLQAWYNTVLSGVGLSSADLANISNALDTSQKNIIAANANLDETKIFIVAGLSVALIIAGILYYRHKKKNG